MITRSVIVGPDEHGVVRHAVAVAHAAGAIVERHPDALSCVARAAGAGDVTHWHFTDRLFAPTAPEAATAFVRVASRAAGRRVVTLHDVPPATEQPRDVRRADAYRRVAASCDAVVVSSAHERRRVLGADIAADPQVHVIPLPVVATGGVAAGSGGRDVAVLGFVYPGKGHEVALAALGDAPSDVGLTVIGRASDGHDDVLAALRRQAATLGRRLVVTGFVDDVAMADRLRGARVPVVPATDVSASASVGAWIGAGRRPLVAANDYTRELDGDFPGLMTLYEPGALGAAIGHALRDPSATWRAGPIPEPLGMGAVAGAHVDLYRRLLP